jgi:hypothetical protein
MKKQEFQLRTANLKIIYDLLEKACESGKVFKLELSEWREKATDTQRGLYWRWMEEIAEWANSCGMKQQIYTTDPQGKPRLVGEKPWDKDFSHEFIMQYFYPKGEDGKRMSLTVILKNRGEMSYLLDRLNPWCLEKGFSLSIPNRHWYWENKRTNG